MREQHGYLCEQGGYALPMSRPRPLPSVAGMHHEPFLYDLVRAHERDLRSAADQHRLVRAVRPDRPTFLGYLRVATLAWLARGAQRAAPSPARPRHHRPRRRVARLASGRHRVERLARVRGGQHRGPAAQLVEQRGPGRPRRVRVVVEQVCERGIE